MWRLSLLAVAAVAVLAAGTAQAQLFDITAPGDPILGVPDDNNWPANEEPPGAIDDNVGVKYLCFETSFVRPDSATGGAGFRVTPSQPGFVVTALNFASANDATARDPITFQLWGSNESIDGPYELIAEGTIDDFNLGTTWPRNEWISAPIEIDNNKAYKHYEVFFPEIRDRGPANSMQIGEVELLTDGSLPGAATDPSPADEATDVARDVILSWTAGQMAASHDVYFGTSFDDVNAASRANPMGVLVSQGQTDTVYAPEGLLEYGQTYYWRVDEVNAAPDFTIFTGDVWSFTVEPFAYPVQNIIATSNATSEEGVGPENTINGSGLNEMDQHSDVSSDMWLGLPAGTDPVYIQYEFDSVYKMHELLVWNYNVQFEPILGFGLKDVTVEYSADGIEWTALGDYEFAQATARSDYTANTIVAFDGVPAKFVRLTVNAGWGMLSQYGLSEVRFMFIPATAREPQPADGETEVPVDTALAWRAGREAVTHDVYLGTDPDALPLVDSVSEPIYVPNSVVFGNIYYWKIDEVNEADEIGVWPGPVWTFTSQEFALIDGFEEYDDEDNRIYDSWLDGFINGNGSTVGYFEAPFAEQSIVNSGSQSMPLEYNNTGAPFYSEAEKDLGSLDLTANGADSLRLFVAGQAPAFAEAADGTILMNAIGTDIWDSADEFRYAYKQLTGDGSMVARVDALDGAPSTWAKAGVMVRQSTAGGSTHSFMCMTGGDGNGASWQGRPTENAASVNNDATSPVAPPYWVRIDRAGDSLTGFVSPDGETWTQIGDPRSIAMTDPVLIGLALTSHNAAQATSAQFSNVTTTGSVAGVWQIAEIGVAQPEGNAPESLYVALEDTSGNVAVVTHPDENITARSGWNAWMIPYGDLAGVNLSRIAIIYVGVGDRDNPTTGGSGLIFIDDIGYGTPLVHNVLTDVTNPGDAVQGVPNDGDWPGAETPDLAIDNDVNTKYLHFKGDFDPDVGPSGLRVTPSVGATVVTELTLTTANDVPGRDPIAFELYGSNDGIGGPYTLIASGDVVDFAGETEWPRFTMNETPITFDNDVAYTSYQLLFTAIRGPVGGSVNSMQIAEVELIGVLAP